MKKKLLTEIGITVALLAALYGGFSMVDWLQVFHLKEDTVAEKVMKLAWEIITNDKEEITAPEVVEPVDSIINHLRESNQITDSVDLKILYDSEVNAFATFGNRMVVYTGLLKECRNENELAGVLAHELAHLESGHVVKNMSVQMVLTMAVGMVSGSSGTAAQLAQLLAGSAFQRSQESEADRLGIQYMEKANMKIAAFGDLMNRIVKDDALERHLELINSHPYSKDRAAIIYKAGKKQKTIHPLLHPETWQAMKQEVDVIKHWEDEE